MAAEQPPTQTPPSEKEGEKIDALPPRDEEPQPTPQTVSEVAEQQQTPEEKEKEKEPPRKKRRMPDGKPKRADRTKTTKHERHLANAYLKIAKKLHTSRAWTAVHKKAILRALKYLGKPAEKAARAFYKISQDEPTFDDEWNRITPAASDKAFWDALREDTDPREYSDLRISLLPNHERELAKEDRRGLAQLYVLKRIADLFVAGDKLYAYNAATALWDVTDHIDEFLLRDVSEDLSMILGVTSVWSTEGDLTRLCDAADVAAIALFARSYLRDEARALLIDRLAHLTVMAGGLVHDTRKGITRQRTREDYFTSES